MSKISNFLLGINPDKAFNTISSGIDKLAFTKQERAEINMKLADKVAQFAEKTLSENTIRSKSRRFVAYLVVLSYILCLGTSIFYDNEMLHYIVKDSALSTGFVWVLAFFFGGYIMSNTSLLKKK